jgi:hypothetical protein
VAALERPQAVLFDLAARKFYIFGLVLWPQDFIFLTSLLVISALALFLFTAVAGRLWCGYACPQTVYTEIFMWIEERIEGNHLARIKLDREAAGQRKIALKTAKHAMWIGLSLWTGFTFVGYFTPIRTLIAEVGAFSLGPWETFWILFYVLRRMATRAGCASRCASTCVRTRASKASCSIPIRWSSLTMKRAASRAVRAAGTPTIAPRVWAPASTAASACRHVRPASTFGAACSTNA